MLPSRPSGNGNSGLVNKTPGPYRPSGWCLFQCAGIPACQVFRQNKNRPAWLQHTQKWISWPGFNPRNSRFGRSWPEHETSGNLAAAAGGLAAQARFVDGGGNGVAEPAHLRSLRGQASIPASVNNVFFTGKPLGSNGVWHPVADGSDFRSDEKSGRAAATLGSGCRNSGEYPWPADGHDDGGSAAVDPVNDSGRSCLPHCFLDDGPVPSNTSTSKSRRQICGSPPKGKSPFPGKSGSN